MFCSTREASNWSLSAPRIPSRVTFLQAAISYFPSFNKAGGWKGGRQPPPEVLTKLPIELLSLRVKYRKFYQEAGERTNHCENISYSSRGSALCEVWGNFSREIQIPFCPTCHLVSQELKIWKVTWSDLDFCFCSRRGGGKQRGGAVNTNVANWSDARTQVVWSGRSRWRCPWSSSPSCGAGAAGHERWISNARLNDLVYIALLLWSNTIANSRKLQYMCDCVWVNHLIQITLLLNMTDMIFFSLML